VILSFADAFTEKIFKGERLTRQEAKALGDLRINKAQERLQLLNAATEKQLLLTPPAHYHALKGTNRYSIDANNRSSKWRITFSWEKDNLSNVELVTIEDTHQ
jgi:plasmid maintenance system killer protein